jgi:hypothetical protein
MLSIHNENYSIIISDNARSIIQLKFVVTFIDRAE